MNRKTFIFTDASSSNKLVEITIRIDLKTFIDKKLSNVQINFIQKIASVLIISSAEKLEDLFVKLLDLFPIKDN